MNIEETPAEYKVIKRLTKGWPKVTEKTIATLKKAAKDLETDPEYQTMWQKSVFVVAITNAMHESGISQNELARRLKVSRQYISRALSHDANFTIESMVRIALVVGLRLEITLEKQ